MNGIIEISWLQLLSAYLFIIVLLIIVNIKKIKREKDIVISSLRMTFQLILVGYILDYVFNNRNPIYTILILAIMETFAIITVFQRLKNKMSRSLKLVTITSLLTGSILCLLYFLLVVIGIRPWYNPQYFIPIAGMILGNSMNGTAIAATRMINSFEEQRSRIEAALMLGASPKKASQDIINSTFESAIMPTINQMIGMGIISLPGMMTGQVLAGNSPFIATKYQIAIMLAILGSVSLSTVLFVELGYKTFFNKRAQLVIEQSNI